jgi:hypothetical protein
LDLNTTAKKGERGIEKSSPYLINATYAVLTAEMAVPIGSFNEELELRKLKQAQDAEAEDAKYSLPPPSAKGPAPSIHSGALGKSNNQASQPNLSQI